MKVVRTIADLRAALDPGPGRAASIGLVPTMGALHDGHRSLIAAAREGSEQVVVSLFVNPAQFGRGEDLERYPRDEARDIASAEAAGVDVLFAPDADQMYPDGFDTWIDPGKVGTFLEGSSRPGHFRGVATICTKLFLLVKPQRAYFGRKDAQQVAVAKQLVRDLELPVEIVACPTVRDVDGLALSSRNVFLSPEERQAALILPRALQAGLAAHRSGNDAVRAARDVLDAEPRIHVDYVAEADLDGPTLAAAVVVGSTRLIDNVLLDAEA
ncbi:MAG: pantoate--beta-alanine ligase [Chloroflexota bacterium]